ncbi:MULTISPECIES: LysR family transcriptional regulator [unclassified Pseudomonas]|uniref:LysR family transcriptional regulator n=1 Tax=unclassified Pseudomonas TaxID=196821 RepID=UPI0030D84281
MNHLVRKLDFTSLRLFVTVCQEKNIARAAERECITPSAVSRRIAEIEAIVGLPIIHRESRGISVTPVGEMIIRHAKSMIASLESLNAELSQFTSGAKGSVQIAANLSAIVQFLPEDLAAFKRLFPEVEILVDEHSSAHVMRSVTEGNAEIGICNANYGTAELEFLPYRTDRLVLVVPRGHHLAEASSVTFNDIARESFVGLSEETSLMTLLAQRARDIGEELDVKIRVRSLDVLCRMVHVKLGVAVVPQLVAELNMNALDLRVVPIVEPWSIRKLVVVFRHRDRLTATAAALVNYLTNKH